MSEIAQQLRCPVCRATYRQNSSCQRCGSDLSGLLSLVLKACKLRESGKQALLNYDFAAARVYYLASLQIHNHRHGRIGLLLSERLLSNES